MSKIKRPMSAEQVIDSIGLISQLPVTSDPMERGLKGAIIGILDNLLGSREVRIALLFRLFPEKWSLVGDSASSNDLTEGEWIALKRWVGPSKPEGERWQGSPDFVSECAQLNYHLDIKVGQQHLGKGDEFFEEFCNGRFGCVPVMMCGHKSNSLTAIFNPFCSLCANSGQNKEAYKMKTDQTVMEMSQ
jgi:hypothetical protein